jgi:serine/threonine protein kinase
MNAVRLEPGTVLAEKYRLESVLGVGGMGTVYRAEHLALKAPVAIKVIDREVAEGDVALARFMREAQSAASLRSPHVVQILDYGMEGNRPFMVMEMLEGEPLADRIRRLGRLTPGETYRVISHIARAVSRAHEADIIHRDLKPDNVFLVHNEGDEIAKVLDFGVAKVESTQLDGEGHTRTGSLLGTPYYMSPEQAQGNKHIDARSDLWALGVIAFECITGKRPFSSDGLGDLVLQICIRDIPVPSKVLPVPPGFDAWFKKACARDPDERFQTARELALELRPALGLGSDPGGSVPESRWSQVASLPQGGPYGLASHAPTLGSETVGPDSAPSRPNSEDARPTEIDGPKRPPTLDDDLDEGREGSRWEVVPHDAPRRAKRRVLSEPPLHEESGGGSIAFVAIIALLIGGAVVFGMRQAGFTFPGQEWTRPRATVFRPSPGPRTQKETKAAEEAEKAKAAQGSGKGQKGAKGPSPDGKPKAEGEPGDAALADEPVATEEDLLKAIEDAAAKAADGQGDGTEKGTDKPPTDKPEEGAPVPGPEPRVPDGLAPAPTPPPAPN